MAAIQVDDVISAMPLHRQRYRAKPCVAGQHWIWDGVHFSIVHPVATDQQNNNASCVLVIRYRDQHIVLPGDIEHAAEQELLTRDALPQHVDALIAPHHGSKTSSTQAWVEWLQPKHVLFATGYRNRFHFPHAQVVTRYQTMGSSLWNTATHGAIQISFDETGGVQVAAERDRHSYLWRDKSS